MNNEESLKEIHSISMTTIEVLTSNMISGDMSVSKLFEYYKDVNRQNVIKLLLRCKKLYQARVDVKTILLAII